MPKISLKKALATLSRPRLLAIASSLELNLPSEMRKEDMVEVLLESQPKVEPILNILSESELITICRVSGLDDSGQEKGVFIARLLAQGELVLREDTPARGPDRPPVPELPQMFQPAPKGKLTLRKLESLLWEAANILRGKIDSADFKYYILALLVFKRLSDRWEEEYERLLKKLGDPGRAAQEHPFRLPLNALWYNVRRHTENIGLRLNLAFHHIEQSDARLDGVFQSVDFNIRERFTDETWELLLRHFDRIRLRNCDVEPDMLGNAYEYLIAQFADDAGKKGGEFYTPKQVVRLLVECLRPEEGMSVYDPACGSGGMLLGAVHYLARGGRDPRSLRLYGQEMNLSTWSICRMNLFLHDIDDVSVLHGDTLRDPKHLTRGNGLRTFDRVLANPPFSLKNWGHDKWRDDRYRRDRYGCPSAKYGDLAFVQHMVESLNPTGMLGVVLPRGVLFRGGAEKRIRRGLVQDDLIEAVIELAPKLFYGTSVTACVMVINRSKKARRRGKVLFVDGAGEMRAKKSKNELSETNVRRLAQAFRAFRNQPGFARVVSVGKIADNDFDLSIHRYMTTETADQEEPVDVSTQLRKLEELEARREVARSKMNRLLADLGYEP